MNDRSEKKRRIVYSSDEGRLCPACGQPVSGCVCGRRQAVPSGDSVVRVGRETKGRKGAGVTVITGLPLAADDLRRLAKALKKRCGSGGTVKEGIIEIQGDHRDLLVAELAKQGYTVKKAGG